MQKSGLRARTIYWERRARISSWPGCNSSPLARGRIHLCNWKRHFCCYDPCTDGADHTRRHGVQSAPGYAQLIEVGSARAANVPVAISMGNDAAYGPQVDGLLGMTFLARFDVTLSGGALDLKARVLK